MGNNVTIVPTSIRRRNIDGRRSETSVVGGWLAMVLLLALLAPGMLVTVGQSAMARTTGSTSLALATPCCHGPGESSHDAMAGCLHAPHPIDNGLLKGCWGFCPAAEADTPDVDPVIPVIAAPDTVFIPATALALRSAGDRPLICTPLYLVYRSLRC